MTDPRVHPCPRHVQQPAGMSVHPLPLRRGTPDADGRTTAPTHSRAAHRMVMHYRLALTGRRLLLLGQVLNVLTGLTCLALWLETR